MGSPQLVAGAGGLREGGILVPSVFLSEKLTLPVNTLVQASNTAARARYPQVKR